MRLYHYYRSSCSYRVRIALALKGVDVDTIHVDLPASEQYSSEFLAINPMCRVPALVVPGGTLWESMAIFDWLEQTFPSPPLLPSDAWLRARAIAAAEMINAGIQPLQNLDVERRLSKGGFDGRAFGAGVIARGLAALELACAPIAGVYLVGDAVSWADICLVPQLRNARRFKVDLAPFPTLLRAEETALSEPAFIAASPEAHRPS